jgi:Putative porin
MRKARNAPGTSLARAVLICVFALGGGLAARGEEPRKTDRAAPPSVVSAEGAAVKTAVHSLHATRSKPGGQQAQIEDLTHTVQLLTKRLNAAAALQDAREKKAAEQQAEIEKLARAVDALAERLNVAAATVPAETPHPATVGQVSSLVPVIPAGSAAAGASEPAAVAMPAAAPASAQVEGYTQKVDALGKRLDGISKGLGGFKFSGDLRFRTDAILRSANSVAGPLQNVRERYRVRLNVNKDVADQFGFHVQLGTGTSNNPTTYDSDFAGMNTRGFLWLSEYYGDYHPTKNFSVRAGKMEEVFADDAKFLFDDDIRFNGMQEIARTDLSDTASVELRAGQYIFSNPNVQVLPSAAACAGAIPPAACVFEKAGYAPGGKVRDANLFHQGAVLHARSGEHWKHQFTTDLQVYRNPNQFLIASSASAGVPVLVNGYTGVQLAGGSGQLGNGTTAAGGFEYTAPDYHVGRIGYKVEYDGWKTARESWPLSLDVQATRNFGGRFLNNAWMGTVSFGKVKKAGDVRFLYGYFVKEANSMIAQVTDDDIGTGVSVNTRTHFVRIDLGLTRYLQWQNLLYIQNEISASDPARNFFVASPARGAGTQYRIHSQFAISF